MKLLPFALALHASLSSAGAILQKVDAKNANSGNPGALRGPKLVDDPDGSLIDHDSQSQDTVFTMADVAPCRCTGHGMWKAGHWGMKSCEELGCPSMTDRASCAAKYFQPKYPNSRFCEWHGVCRCTGHGMWKAGHWGMKSCEELGCPSITDPAACAAKYFQPKYPDKRFCEWDHGEVSADVAAE